jgi:hypothetical protein
VDRRVPWVGVRVASSLERVIVFLLVRLGPVKQSVNGAHGCQTYAMGRQVPVDRRVPWVGAGWGRLSRA